MKGRAYIIFLLLICIFCACSGDKKNSIFAIHLPTTEAKEFNLTRIKGRPATVITFFSPECPLSESYARVMLNLENQISLKNVLFIAVIPGNLFSDDAIKQFVNKYNILQPVLLDTDKVLTNYLKASITPETFLLNNKGEVVYSGAIDNWAVDLGTKRQLTTEHYLLDAVNAVLKGKEIKTGKTTAVGCYIE